MSDRLLARVTVWLHDLLFVIPVSLPADVAALLIAALGSRGGP